ncbi:(3R)-3-hydroxyacyl-CoA dehydrogenase isoform X2 [Strix uralensis]|uniref:(3R)-3-hydroxyacyl-CoA dehydrogenase isoform X2 n=1 Tax=Strix uralensis TaxID=36305 RepID=UPI003DA6D6D4
MWGGDIPRGGGGGQSGATPLVLHKPPPRVTPPPPRVTPPTGAPGGASGIGRAVCARLARDGARLAVADRDEVGAGDTVGRLHAGGTHTPHAGSGGPPHPHAAFGVDVASAPSVTQLLARVQEYFGVPPSICVGCAGVTRDEFLLRLEEGPFREVLGVNLTGTFLVTQAVARALVAAGAPGGSIIHVGSIVGKVGNLGQANYTAAKAGVEGLTRSCAKELARFGIRCNVVLPGFIVTPMTDKVPPKVLEKGWCRWDVSGSRRTWRMFAPSWPRRRAATSRGPAWR